MYKWISTLVLTCIGFTTIACADNIGFSDCFCGCSYSIEGDWLYWKVQQENLLAGSFIDDHPDPVFKHVESSGVTQDFKYNSGFRINLGLETPCHSWDFIVSYSYMPFKSHSKFFQAETFNTTSHRQYIIGNISAFPIMQAFSTNSGPDAFTSMFSKWNGELNYIDVDIQHPLTFCDCFILTPHIGFRAAWLHQRFRVDGDLLTPSINESDFARFKFDEKFHGYGIEGGFWVNWECCCGWSLIGHVGGSILYGNFKISQLTRGYADNDLVFQIHSPFRTHTAVPTVEYFLGIEYQNCYCDYMYNIHAGWEQRVFFNLNNIAVGEGNFTTQGLTLGMEVEF